MAMSTWFQQLCGGDKNVRVEIVQDNAAVHRRADDVDVDHTSVGYYYSSSSPTSPSKEGKHVASRWSSIPELTRMTTTTKYTKKAKEPHSRTYRSKTRPSSEAATKIDSSLAIQPPKRIPSDEFLCDFDDDDDDDVPCTLTTPYGDVIPTCTTITNTPIGWPYDGEYRAESDDIDYSRDGNEDDENGHDFYNHGYQRWNEATIDAVESMRSSSGSPPPMPCRRYSVAA